MARILIVGGGERGRVLAGALQSDGHVVVETSPSDRRALEHVAIVCWLEGDSPERFLLRAVDSSMRGFVYQGGGQVVAGCDWEDDVAHLATRNAIPSVARRADPSDLGVWLAEARTAVGDLLGRRYPDAYT